MSTTYLSIVNHYTNNCKLAHHTFRQTSKYFFICPTYLLSTNIVYLILANIFISHDLPILSKYVIMYIEVKRIYYRILCKELMESSTMLNQLKLRTTQQKPKKIMSKNTLTLEEKNKVVESYLLGTKPLAIGKEFNVPTSTINAIVADPVTRLVVEKKHLELTRSKENRRIDDIKEQLFGFIETSVTEAIDLPNKMAFLDKVSKIISDLDRISRLNRGDITSNDQTITKNVTIDVAEILKTLDTPDKKRDYLRSQLVVNESNEVQSQYQE